MISSRPADGHTITAHVEKDDINNTKFFKKDASNKSYRSEVQQQKQSSGLRCYLAL
jgi:hypothetical protein